jgi:hypothetical protein
MKDDHDAQVARNKARARHKKDLDILVAARRKSEDLSVLTSYENDAFQRALVFVKVVDEARHPVTFLIQKVENHEYYQAQPKEPTWEDPTSDAAIVQRRQRALARYR